MRYRILELPKGKYVIQYRCFFKWFDWGNYSYPHASFDPHEFNDLQSAESFIVREDLEMKKREAKPKVIKTITR